MKAQNLPCGRAMNVPGNSVNADAPGRGRLGWMAGMLLGWMMCLAGERGWGLEVTQIRVDAANVEVGFQNAEATAATEHRLEHASTLASPVQWEAMEGVRIETTGVGLYRAVGPRPPGEMGFFRLVARTSGGPEVTSAVFGPGPLVGREGDTAGPKLVFSRPYSGTLRYVYTGPGFEQSGETNLTGATEWVLPPPPRLDDDAAGPLEYASLRLERLSGGTLDVEPPATVLMEDNDEAWRGVLVGDGNVGFSFLVLSQGSVVRARVRGDETSLFPQGDYPTSTFVRTASRFEARIGGLTWEDGSPPFEGRMVGELALETVPGETDHQIGETTISGRYTWRMASVDRPHLAVIRSGGFVLQRQPASAPATKVPLRDAAP